MSRRPQSALGHDSPNTSSPEGAKQDSANSLLKILLAKREAGFRGRGKYHPPTEPDLAGLPEPPIGWMWASPEQLSNAVPYSLGIGPFGSNLKVSDYQQSGTPLIFVRNIRAEDFGLVAKFVTEQKAKELAAHTAEGGDILITKMGEPPGDAAYYPIGAPKAVITADCIKWRLADELRVPKFFVYAIRSRSVQQQIQNRTRGVAQKKISLERFRDLAIPLPPLPEQRRIVAEIEKQFTRLEAGVAALRRVQANLKRYRAAVLKAACEGRLVPTEAELQNGSGVPPLGPGKKRQDAASTFETGAELLARILTERRQNWQGRGQYKEPAAPDTANLPPLPEGYVWASFGQICRVQGGFAFKSTEYVKEGVPLVRISNLVNGRVQVSEDTVFLPPAFAAANPAFLLRKGDVLIAMSGATTGKMATMDDDIPALLNQRVGRFVLSSEELSNAKFVSYLVMQITQKVLKDAYGAAQPNISPAEIEEFPIPLPPLAEQTRIVAEVERRLSVVEELESVVSANLQRATRLRQSILQKAFTGGLVSSTGLVNKPT